MRGVVPRASLEHVEPDEAEVADVLLDEVGNVVVPHEQHVERHVLAVAHELVLAAAELQTAAVEQVEGFVGEASRFLHGDAQALLAIHQRSPRRRAASS